MESGTKQTRGTGEEVYNFIVDFIKKNGYAPSVRENCAGTDISSTSKVSMHLLKLEEEGKVEMKRRAPRAIKVIGYQFVKIEESV